MIVFMTGIIGAISSNVHRALSSSSRAVTINNHNVSTVEIVQYNSKIDSLVGFSATRPIPSFPWVKVGKGFLEKCASTLVVLKFFGKFKILRATCLAC